MTDRYESTPPRERVIERRSGGAGWWVAGIVAVVAVVAVAFMLTNGRPSSDDLQAARDQGAAQATMSNAAQDAQQAASNAANAAQDAASNAAQATEHAARTAADKTAQAADSAGDAAQDAAANAPQPRP